jgi:hypothetical protein
MRSFQKSMLCVMTVLMDLIRVVNGQGVPIWRQPCR